MATAAELAAGLFEVEMERFRRVALPARLSGRRALPMGDLIDIECPTLRDKAMAEVIGMNCRHPSGRLRAMHDWDRYERCYFCGEPKTERNASKSVLKRMLRMAAPKPTMLQDAMERAETTHGRTETRIVRRSGFNGRFVSKVETVVLD